MVYQRAYPKSRFSQDRLAEYAGYEWMTSRSFAPSASTTSSIARPVPRNSRTMRGWVFHYLARANVPALCGPSARMVALTRRCSLATGIRPSCSTTLKMTPCRNVARRQSLSSFRRWWDRRRVPGAGDSFHHRLYVSNADTNDAPSTACPIPAPPATGRPGPTLLLSG